MFTNTKNQSQFYPDQDVIKRTDDGREIVVARAGSPLPMEKARELGLIDESGKTLDKNGVILESDETVQTEEVESEEKAKTPANNKAKTPKENK